jgi:hypothetical protein
VLETARQLGDLPETAACLKWGEFSAQQVKEIASAATVHPGAEGELIEAAARSGLKGLRTRCRRTKALASWENDEVGRENAIRKSRFFRHYRDPDGAVRIEARLTPADGARIIEAVRAKAGYYFDRARKAGLHESMSAYGTGIARPHVILRVDLAALRRGELEQGEGDGGEVCEIPGVGTVSLATATRILGDSFVKIVMVDGVDVHSVCHLGRTVPAHLQTALEERDPVCVVPRCENDCLLEVHHIVAFTEGGPTALENLVRLCRWHHDLVTYEKWTLDGHPGAWEWRPPPDFDGL